jgi:valyl-tRNA synthetase
MPFLTEEVWQQLPHDGDSIMVAAWPTPHSEWIDPDAEIQIAKVIEATRGIRFLRTELSIPPSQQIPVQLGSNSVTQPVLEDAQTHIRRLAKADPIEFYSLDAASHPLGFTHILPDVEIVIPKEVLADPDRERRRIQRELEAATDEVARLQARLGSNDFVTRAPSEVVERERGRLREIEARRRRLAELLRDFR